MIADATRRVGITWTKIAVAIAGPNARKEEIGVGSVKASVAAGGMGRRSTGTTAEPSNRASAVWMVPVSTGAILIYGAQVVEGECTKTDACLTGIGWRITDIV